MAAGLVCTAPLFMYLSTIGYIDLSVGGAVPAAYAARVPALEDGLLPRIIASYKSPIVRTYCRIRFLIIRQRFLKEVGQYLPEKGNILDVGCGFGLFGLYFAGGSPERRLTGCDLNARRIAMARLAARNLGIRNVRFNCADAAALSPQEQFDAIYTLDLIHHLPRTAVPDFLRSIRGSLAPSGVLIIKDVDRRPAYKRWFTLLLDRLMVGLTEPIYYWPEEELRAVLREVGFQVVTHRMIDILPYPHILYVCRP
ncbi:MAG: class I SAM-dependent methyltransferase [Phycisphaerae bacterium]|jgi:2-polyprenyl-3-methyl-5-hydroxy-6-metoxy-1,4-benzoquinol methylase